MKVLVYTFEGCQNCENFIKKLEDNNIEYYKEDIQNNITLAKVAGFEVAPIVVVGRKIMNKKQAEITLGLINN